MEQSLSDWCSSLIMSAPSEVTQLFATICYHVWKARNTLYLEGRDSSVFIVVNQAVGTLQSYQEFRVQLGQGVQVNATSSRQRWRVPEVGSLKINVDASRSGTLWGLGIVVRNHFRNVLVAASKVLLAGYGPEYAEACAIKWGMQFALDRGFSDVCVESDYKGVVDAVVQRRPHGSYLSARYCCIPMSICPGFLSSCR